MCKILLTNDQIQSICVLLGKQLSSRFLFSKNPPVFICSLNGGIPFAYELSKNMSIPIQIDYVEFDYLSKERSKNSVRLKRDVSLDLSNRDIVCIEALVESGYTLSYELEYLQRRFNPSSITTVCLLSNENERKENVKLDFVGQVTEEPLLVGFGLDYNSLYQNKSYVFTPDEKDLESMNALKAI